VYVMKRTKRLAMVASVPPVLASLLIFASGSAGAQCASLDTRRELPCRCRRCCRPGGSGLRSGSVMASAARPGPVQSVLSRDTTMMGTN
jgi:hypothetical protein